MTKGATLTGFMLGGILAVFVFIVKYEVQDLESEFSQLNRNIAQARQSVHVLRAEWSYLNEPARLRKLAEKHLNLTSTRAHQVGGLHSISHRTDSVRPDAPVSGNDLSLVQATIQKMLESERAQ